MFLPTAALRKRFIRADAQTSALSAPPLATTGGGTTR